MSFHFLDAILTLFLKFFFFNVGHFLSLYWICYNIASVFLCFWNFGKRHMRGLSYLPRDWAHTPFIERWSLNHWTKREVPSLWLFKKLCIPWFVLATPGHSWRLSLVAAREGYSLGVVRGPLVAGASRGSTWASGVVAHGHSCSWRVGSSLGQGANPCSLHWQANS